MIRRIAIALVALLLLTGASGVGLHYYYKARIFRASDQIPDPADVPFPVEVVRIPTADGLQLNSWWIPPQPGKRTVLYLHGNYRSIGHYPRGVQALVGAGYGVLMLDYRGYGGNPGAPGDEGLLRDAEAALDWLAAKGIAPATVVAYGYSLGTGVAVPLAAERDLAAVILAAPFASIAEMGYDQYPHWFVDLLLSDRFDSIGRIAAVSEPVLIFHGDADTTVPVTQSARLAAAGGGNIHRIVLPGATHGWDLFEPRGNALVLDFLADLDRRGLTPPPAP
ncbi:MAG: alpha/beta hydrolase [Rhodothalassiaceae bacterium]